MELSLVPSKGCTHARRNTLSGKKLSGQKIHFLSAEVSGGAAARHGGDDHHGEDAATGADPPDAGGTPGVTRALGA